MNQPKRLSSSVRVRFLDAPAILEKLRLISKDILENNYNVLGIYIFGSLATGNYAPGSDADILISVNPANSSDPGSNGSSCFYFQGFKSYSISGKKIANLIQNKLVYNLNYLDCRVHGANFAILKETKMTAVVVEPAFISNQKDRNNLKDTTYQMRISSSITDAILQFLNE